MTNSKEKKQDLENNVTQQVLEISKSVLQDIFNRKKLPWPDLYAESFWDLAYLKKYDDLLLEKSSDQCVTNEQQEYFVKQAELILSDFLESVDLLNEATCTCSEEISEPVKALINRAKTDSVLAEDLKKIILYSRKLESSLEDTKKRLENNALRISELKQEIRLDDLTMTFNRKAMIADLNKEIEQAKRYGHPLSILMADIDHFKKINDEYGHQIGDLILVNISKIMKDCIRQADSLYRYGGEEFLVTLPHIDIEGARKMSKRLCRMIESYSFVLRKGTLRLSVTVSIGITQMKDNEISISSFIERADDAMYVAKKNGRNQVAWF